MTAIGVSAGPERTGRPNVWPAGKRNALRFVDRSLASLSESVERDLVAEECARADGWLQRLDPRAKVVGACLLIAGASLLRHLPLLVAFYLAMVAVGLAARLPSRLLLGRVWLALPLFTGVVAMPAVFGFVTPGPPVAIIGWPGGPALVITEPGVRTASTLVIRVAASVTAVLLLVLTTHWPVLLKALRALRVPDALVLVLAMTYRYIFLLARTANAMLLARKSRAVGPLDGAAARRWVAAMTVSLLGKSYHLSNEIYLAMLARGFRGEWPSLRGFRMRPVDWLALCAAALVVAGFVLADRRYVGPW